MRRIGMLMATMLMTVRTLSASAQAPPQEFFVEASVSNAAPFVGQQTIYRFRLYSTTTRAMNANYIPPDFEGLWRTDMGEATNFIEQVNGQVYSVAQLEVALFPTYAGQITIEPAGLVIPATVFEDEVTLLAKPVMLNVQPLPEGAPPGFSGAVGQFNMQATLDRQTAAQGEPIRLRLTVSGTGNIEQLPAPELPLPDAWGVYPNPITYRNRVENGVLVGEKTFEWLISPAHPGTQTLPQITLHYFDPDPSVMAYRSVSTSAVTLDILPGTTTAAQPTEAAVRNRADPASLLPPKPIPASLNTSTAEWGPFFWLLWLIPPAAALGAWARIRQQQIALRTQAQRQASSALQKALAALQTARKSQPDAAYRLLADAMYGYFGDKLNRTPTGLSQADLREVMERHLLPESVRSQVLLCLEWADSGRYAPAGSTDVQMLIERTQKTLSALDAAWK